jgi:hypothetical protein
VTAEVKLSAPMEAQGLDCWQKTKRSAACSLTQRQMPWSGGGGQGDPNDESVDVWIVDKGRGRESRTPEVGSVLANPVHDL